MVQNEDHFPEGLFKMKATEVRLGHCMKDSFWNRPELPHLKKQCHCSNSLRTQRLLALLAVPGSSERYPQTRRACSRRQSPAHNDPLVWSIPPSLARRWLWPHLFVPTAWAQLTSRAAASSSILLAHLGVIHTTPQGCSSSEDPKWVLC